MGVVPQVQQTRMSIRCMNLVWKNTSITVPAIRLVLVALADAADDEGRCYPSVSTIARKSSLSERSVQRVLRRLVGDGVMAVDRRAGQPVTTPGGKQRTNLYRLDLGKIGGDTICHHPTPNEVVTASVTTQNKVVTPERQGGDSGGTKVVTPRDQGGDIAVSPRTTENPRRTQENQNTYSPAADAERMAERWSQRDRGHGLSVNDVSAIHRLAESVAQGPPVYRGQRRFPAERMLAEAVDCCMRDGAKFKAIGYAVTCIQNKIDTWRRDGVDDDARVWTAEDFLREHGGQNGQA